MPLPQSVRREFHWLAGTTARHQDLGIMGRGHRVEGQHAGGKHSGEHPLRGIRESGLSATGWQQRDTVEYLRLRDAGREQR
jgi:hypothetical protein